MKHKQPKDGAPGTTDQWPRWEGPQGSKPAGYLRAKDNVEKSRDANTEKGRSASDALKQKSDD